MYSDGTISDYFVGNTGVRQECVLAQTLFNTCMNHVLGRIPGNPGCRVSLGTVRITEFDFADNAFTFAETNETVLIEALESLSEEAEPLELRVMDQDQVQAFCDTLDVTSELVAVSGENMEVTHTFTFLGSMIHSSTICEVDRRLGRARSALDSLDEGVWLCRYSCRTSNIRVLCPLVLPALLYSCETLTDRRIRTETELIWY